MNSTKKAIITGITGQDGAYLAELLLNKNYKVYGTYRRTSSENFWRIEELGIKEHKNLILYEFDLIDESGAIRMIKEIMPDEIYNLAAQSFVGVSFKQPLGTAKVDALGPLHILEAIRIINPKIKFYQASTSELYGLVQEIPQTEKTPFYPRSPYGVAKLFAHWSTINYRESYGIFGCCGILFNHESPLRGREFVTRKITDAVAKIKLGKLSHVELGNLDAKRDWGFAKDYVEGMYRIMQSKKPDVYVLATNRTTTIRDFVEMAFKTIDVNIDWSGEGANEIGKCQETGKILVKVNPEFFRPAEVELLIGDASKAKRELDWEAKTSLEELCKMMVEADLKRNSQGISF